MYFKLFSITDDENFLQHTGFKCNYILCFLLCISDVINLYERYSQTGGL